MAVTSYASFYSSVRPRVAPCPDQLILQALQFAVRQFCIDSEAYVWESDPYDLSTDEFVYTLDQAPTAIYDVMRVKDVRIKLDSDTSSFSNKGNVVWDRAYTFIKPNILQFVDPPVEDDYTDSMYVRLIMAPFEDYTTFDWNFVNRWMEPIRAKALAYLYSLPRRLWSDPVQADNFEAIYRRGVAMARRENETEGTNRQLRMAGGSFI